MTAPWGIASPCGGPWEGGTVSSGWIGVLGNARKETTETQNGRSQDVLLTSARSGVLLTRSYGQVLPVGGV